MAEHMPILLGQKVRRVASDAGAGWSQAGGSALAHNNELLALASASGGRGSAQRVSHNLTTKSSHPGTPGSVFPSQRTPTPPPCSGGGEEARPHLFVVGNMAVVFGRGLGQGSSLSLPPPPVLVPLRNLLFRADDAQAKMPAEWPTGDEWSMRMLSEEPGSGDFGSGDDGSGEWHAASRTVLAAGGVALLARD